MFDLNFKILGKTEYLAIKFQKCNPFWNESLLEIHSC